MRIMGSEVSLPESPQAKFWAWIIGIVVGTVAVLVFLDTTFARKAEAISKADAEAMVLAANTAQAAAINLNTEYLIDQQTKRAIDTQLFQIEQIPPQLLRPQDRALYQRLQRDRDELVRLWLQRGRPLR